MTTFDWSVAINWFTKAINNAAEQSLANVDIDDGSSAFYLVTLEDVSVITKDYDSNIRLFQVKSHAAETSGKHNHLSSLYVSKSVNTGDTISHGDNFSGFSIVLGGNCCTRARNAFLKVV
mmetsp:Transcript_27263/g.37427  ORF Transcript_27263/g.37427 Transcript_27263/m.37427 type:complete len:120 (-) Transcript_27263:182-541(-)